MLANINMNNQLDIDANTEGQPQGIPIPVYEQLQEAANSANQSLQES